MRRKMKILLAAALALSAAHTQAAVIASSTFDTDDDGWTVGEYLSSSGSNAPQHLAAGGNPGGFIRTDDSLGWTAFLAPGKFLGNWLALGATSFSWDIRITGADATPYSAIVISNGVTSIEYMLGNPAVNAWNSFSVPLSSATGWTYASGYGNGGAVSNADFLAVLGNVTRIALNADWLSGGDTSDLDNIFLRDARTDGGGGGGSGGGEVPEPSTYALVGGGLAAAAMLRRRTGKA